MLTMDFLSEIVSLKRERLIRSKELMPLEVLEARARKTRLGAKQHALREALLQKKINIIAEIKRASPSLGSIREVVDPALLARIYQDSGAAAVSVLTEEDRFKGSLDDLRAVRSSVRIPVLRKDFIFDEYQVYEAGEAGADALLLIVAALTDDELRRLRTLAEDELHMDALVEVHAAEEVERALNSGARIIGVNNRDLRTFNVSLDTSFKLTEHMAAETIAISESGMRSAQDLQRLKAAGYHGFLIGETLMRADDPGLALASLLAPTTSTN